MILRIEEINVVMGAVLIFVSLLVWHDSRIPLSVAIGSAIGGANFWALTWIVRGFVGSNPHKLRLVALAVLKLAILVFVLWAVIKWVSINAIAFLVGLSTIVVAIVLAYLVKREAGNVFCDVSLFTNDASRKDARIQSYHMAR